MPKILEKALVYGQKGLDRVKYCIDNGKDKCIDRMKESLSVEDLYNDYISEDYPHKDIWIKQAIKEDSTNTDRAINKFLYKQILKNELNKQMQSDRKAIGDEEASKIWNKSRFNDLELK